MLPVVLTILIVWIVLSGVITLFICAASAKFSRSEEGGGTRDKPRVLYKSSKPVGLLPGQIQGKAKNA